MPITRSSVSNTSDPSSLKTAPALQASTTALSSCSSNALAIQNPSLPPSNSAFPASDSSRKKSNRSARVLGGSLVSSNGAGSGAAASPSTQAGSGVRTTSVGLSDLIAAAYNNGDFVHALRLENYEHVSDAALELQNRDRRPAQLLRPGDGVEWTDIFSWERPMARVYEAAIVPVGGRLISMEKPVEEPQGRPGAWITECRPWNEDDDNYDGEGEDKVEDEDEDEDKENDNEDDDDDNDDDEGI